MVVRKLQGSAYILAELNGSVWQNKVVAFRVLPYLSRRKFDFEREVKNLLDASKKSLLELTTELDRGFHTEGSTTRLLNW